MRTTIDLPDSLMERLKLRIAERKMTLRSLVISALEKELDNEPEPFRLKLVTSGDPKNQVSPEAINRAIDEMREPNFRP